MTTPSTDSDSGHEHGAELLARYLRARDRGEKPDPARFADQHPDQAEAFLEALSGLNEVESAIVDDGPPRTLGEFRLLREVGRGGMGIVFEAEQIGLDRRVALKLLPAASMLDQNQVRRFELEARAAAMLDHPHIVPVYGVGVAQGMHYYAMRFVDGTDLGSVMRSARSFATESPGRLQEYCRDLMSESERSVTPTSGRSWLRIVAGWIADAADAVEHSHRIGVLHRDLKPGNLLLDDNGHLWVTDFGLAHLQSAETDITHTGELIGTLAYCSPEQAAGRRADVGVRSDVYALGVTLYQLATFELPFADNDRSALLRRILHDEPQRPRRQNPAIPADLETIIQRAMAKEPSDRYASAGDLAGDLRAFLEMRPIRARPVTLPGRLWRWCRRHPGRSTAWGIALVAVTVGVVVAFAAREALRQRDAARRAEARSEVFRELARAQALARSGHPGQQRESLACARRAAQTLAELPPTGETRATTLELRSTVVEAMSRWDAERYVVDLREEPASASFDPTWQRLAVSMRDGRIGVFGWPSTHDRTWSSLPQWFFLYWPDPEHIVAWGIGRNGRSLFSAVHCEAGIIAMPSPPEDILRHVPVGERVLAFGQDGRTWWGDLTTQGWSAGPSLPPEVRAAGEVGRAWSVRNRQGVVCQTNPGGEMWLFRPETGSVTRIPHTEEAIAADGADGSDTIAVGFHRGEIRLVRPDAEDAVVAATQAHTAAVVRLTVAREGRFVASAGWDDSVQLRDAGDLSLLLKINASAAELDAHEDENGDLWLGPVMDAGNGVAAFRLLPPPALHRMVATPWPEQTVVSAAMHPNGRHVAMTTGAGVVFFDLDRDVAVTHVDAEAPYYLDFTPDGRGLLCGSRDGLQRLPVAVADDGGLRAGPPAWLLRTTGRVHGCLGPEGERYYAQHAAGLEELDLSTGERRGFDGASPGAIQPAASADGRWIATGSWGGHHAAIWDVRAGRLVERVPSHGRAKVAFSPDSRHLVVALTAEVLVLRAGTWEVERRWSREWQGDHPGEIAFTPDGALLALARRERCVLRSTADWSVELDFPLHHGGVIQRLRIGPRGRYLLGPSVARVLQVWDLAAIRAELGF